MKLAFRILAPLVIVVLAVLLAKYYINSKPEPRTMEVPVQVERVDATRLKAQEYQIYLETQGTVRPRTTSVLIPEVSGRVIKVSRNFREGGFFEKGEELLRIDPVDYETAEIVAESAVAQAERALQEEKVRGGQALENWTRLGKTGEPSDMVRRKYQLAEAEARLRAVKAELKKALLDKERTVVKAPFAGRVIEQIVDVGQYVSSNTQLGRAFATDVMEVRLPLTNRELAFVELPESFRGEVGEESINGPDVLLTGMIGRHSGQWTGKVVRVDSSIDESSRQLFVVAEVEDPYRRKEGNDAAPLKIGMFIDALVKGDYLENVFVLPRAAVRVGGEVIVIDKDNRIRRQKVDPIFSKDDQIVIPVEGGGLAVGEVICLTPLSFPANGASVLPTIDGVTPDIEQPPGRAFGEGGKGKGKGSKGKGETGAYGSDQVRDGEPTTVQRS